MFSRDMSQITEKCSLSQCLRILWKIPGFGSKLEWLPKQFFLIQRYISRKIFTKMRSTVFTWSC